MNTYTPNLSKTVRYTSTDLSDRVVSRPIHLAQYDNKLPVLAVTLYDNGRLYTLPDNITSISIRLGKPDGTFVYNPALGVDPNGSIVYFEITTQMTAVAGDIIAVVELSIITEVAQTGYIYIKVDKNPVPQDTIESTNEFKSIREYAEDAKDSAENAERAATASAYHSGLSITSATNASVSATNASVSATNASVSETNAAVSEQNAKTSATNAATSETKAKESETNAKESETNSANSSTLARSYTKGDTNTREGEETDNAYYYMMQAKEASGISMDADFDSQSTNGLQNKVITEWKSQVDADRHSHSNKSVLDKLSENSTGNLQYDGNPISGDVPTNLATLSDLEKYLKANENASFYFGVLNHKFGYYTTEARDESDFHEFGSAGFHVPPKDVYNVSVKASDGALTVSWNDPDDTYIEGVDISHWAGTILVMKADTPPADENDGTVVLTNTVRNQYATNGYVIDGLINNTTYHLYFIPYNQEGDYEYSDNNRYTGMPAKVMLDDVTDISTSGADGSVTVNWTNPSQTKEQDGITATWVKTTVVVKADSQPTSATDGIVYESTDYSENSHTFTVENGKDYYVGFFIESDLGSVTHTTYDTTTSLYATVTVSTEETTLIGKTVTATYGDSGTVSGEIGSMGFVQLKIPYIGEVTFSATDGSETATSKITIESFIPMSVSLSFYSEWCYSMHIGSDSDPDAAVTYVGDNANFTPAKMKYDTDTFDWGSWADAPFIPRPCMLKSDGTVDYYLNPNDYALKEDGTSSDIGNTSYDGNAMVEWGDGVRPIYLTIVPDTDITQATIHISNYAVDDTSTCYPFMDSNGNIIKHFYTPCYAGSLINNKLRSISGQVVMQSKTAEQEMTYAQANGDGYNIELTCDRILINFLLILMSKTLNTENAYGKGNQSGYVNNASSNYGMHNTGTMNSKGLFWGKNVSSASDTSGVKVFGMEDWWGNQWRRMAGLITIAGKIYIKLTHSTADGSTTTGYNTTGSGYISTGLSCSGTNGGFINKVTYNPKYAIPTVSSGSETTYYADGLWFNASDTRFALVGGNCSAGSLCGAFCLDLGDLASTANWIIGAALSCKPLASEA